MNVSSELGAPDGWIAFTKEQMSFCIPVEKSVSCTVLGKPKDKGMEISYDKTSVYPALVLKSKNQDTLLAHAIFNKLVRAIKNVSKGEEVIDSFEPIEDCNNCSKTTSEPDMEIVYIYAEFPTISIFDGASQFITVGIGDMGPELPDPLPDGVAPSDIEKARDPAGMLACTVLYFRTYMIMIQGCTTNLPAFTNYRTCMQNSMRAYANNLKTECYDKYFH